AERSKYAFIARALENADDACALRLVKIWVHVGFGEFQPRKRRRPRRKRLGRRWLLAWNVALRPRPFLDRPERLPRRAIEDVEQTELCRLRDDVDRLAVVRDGQQLRPCYKIVVPQIVVEKLKVPEPLARAQFEREQRVAEQVISLAIASPQIECRRPERKVADAALLVDGELGPCVRAAGRLPRIRRPGVVAELTRPRDRVKRPDEPAGHTAKRRGIAG